MSFLDVVLVALCAGLAILGIFQGLVRQLSSWGGLIFGHLVGARYYEAAQKALGISFRHADVAAYLLLFLGVYLCARLIGALVERLVRGSTLSGTDRFAGALAGLAKGVVLSVLLVIVLVVILPRNPPLLESSRLAPRAVAVAGWGIRIFPDRFADAFREKTGPAPGARDPGPAPAPQPKKRSRK